MSIGSSRVQSETCIWCGTAVEHDSGFLVQAVSEGRCAVFCRLEHVVPWVMRGARWASESCVEPGPVADPSAAEEPPPAAEHPHTCARCGCPLDHDLILLVHRRQAERIVDAFCTLEHLRAWASAGGHWARR